MSDPCKGKQPGHKLPGGKICKGLLDTIEGKAKSRMARKFQNKNLEAVTWVEDDDDDDDDYDDYDDNKENNTTVRRLPHNPNYGKGNNDLTEEDYKMAAKFMKSGGTRKRRKKRKRKRTKKKKKRRRKSTKKRRRRRRTRRKKGAGSTTVGDYIITHATVKGVKPGVRLAYAIDKTYNDDYARHCEGHATRLYPRSPTWREGAIRDCKETVKSFSNRVFKTFRSSRG